MDTALIFDLEKLYKRTFGNKPYKVPGLSFNENHETPYAIHGTKTLTELGSNLIDQYNGVEIWLPTKFFGLPADMGQDGLLFLPYTVVSIRSKKVIVKTPLNERKGTVKELYGLDDYDISLRGFLIDKDRIWPEKELNDLKALYELKQAVKLDNALTNIYLVDKGSPDNQRVVIEDFDLPPVEGGRKHVRPFTMQLCSDNVFVLELDD